MICFGSFVKCQFCMLSVALCHFLSLALSSCWQYFFLYLKQFWFVHANIIFIAIRFFVCFPVCSFSAFSISFHHLEVIQSFFFFDLSFCLFSFLFFFFFYFAELALHFCLYLFILIDFVEIFTSFSGFSLS